MQVSIGDIVEGKVTGLTSFGAFVRLSGGDVGMVHISEVSSTYVKDIKDHLTEGQEVKVKVLSVNDAGKISLSIKQAEPAKAAQSKERSPHKDDRQSKSRSKRTPPTWQGVHAQERPQTFEDMMARFKATSEDRQSDLRKTSNESRRNCSRRGNNSNKF